MWGIAKLAEFKAKRLPESDGHSIDLHVPGVLQYLRRSLHHLKSQIMAIFKEESRIAG
jgi:hypothetical protein